MARGRMISKNLSASRRFVALHEHAGSLAEFAQTLYVLLTAHADDFGRLSGDVQSVKLRVLPGSPRTFQEFREALEHLQTVGLIEWYGADADKCIAVCKFDEHQSGLHKRTVSKFPEPPGISRKLPEIPSQLKGTELKGTEGNRTEAKARWTVGTRPITDKMHAAIVRNLGDDAARIEWDRVYASASLLAKRDGVDRNGLLALIDSCAREQLREGPKLRQASEYLDGAKEYTDAERKAMMARSREILAMTPEQRKEAALKLRPLMAGSR
jgi:hypothetical protein